MTTLSGTMLAFSRGSVWIQFKFVLIQSATGCPWPVVSLLFQSLRLQSFKTGKLPFGSRPKFKLNLTFSTVNQICGVCVASSYPLPE